MYSSLRDASNSKYRNLMLNRGIGQGIFKSLIETFSREREQMPDSRRPGHNERCSIADVVKAPSRARTLL
jgi:hypothetical protein